MPLPILSMLRTLRWHRLPLLVLALLLSLPAAAQPDAGADAQTLLDEDPEPRLALIERLARDPGPASLALLEAWGAEQLRVGADGRLWQARSPTQCQPLPGPAAAGACPADLQEPPLNNRLRARLERALALRRLPSSDPAQRLQAARVLSEAPDLAWVAPMEAAWAQEPVPAVRALLQRTLAAARLASPEAAERLRAARALGQADDPALEPVLREQLATETDPAVRGALQGSLKALQDRLAWGERAAQLFTGLSLGSVLLLVALGLAITYGLMGVINMAHGELMMIGAYATWGVQGAFRQWLPVGAFDYYLLAALPVAFLAAAAVGALMERLVLRWLYGRPLETLLATWGLSLVLMQTVRSLFGAQNVSVENPAWMSGGWQLMPSLSLPFNRLLIVGFAAVVLLGMAFLLQRTRLGLFVRAVTQNRRMASCVGVATARVDTYAFALGSGLAGLAGCALSQIGNVGPDLGQSYIVDAFMVVVLGGVGQLAGTVYAALGLGLAAKALEAGLGAVLAKIALLVILIAVIQKRPQGLFAMKGRAE
ncbi:urea ABC transporter permease subunit UrtB [Pelomonas sp. APW6]|uniref:Urea ABC transporter permease subunit UrtB n=1 Tax=Roseateles subflavus TaxID=3053353 RepID=A0ABT7LBR3_9BURK|nr:urea ABC transporter permease subunit UrtB [Pelomonas sp. APW6]MDL5030304.1 urea ABC transporter permease subunit UrtB [Pelomonas sp. APW6]